MSWLLDTNVCVGYLRGRSEAICSRIRERDPGELRLCSIVMAELWVGALKSHDPVTAVAKVGAFAAPFRSLPFDEDAARRYGEIRAALERDGRRIGPYDMQIAAVALVHGLTLVTHNTGEFQRVSNLTLEDWEVPQAE